MKKYTVFFVLLISYSLMLATAGCTFENAFPLSGYCQNASDCSGNNVCISGECRPESEKTGDSGDAQQNYDDVRENHDTGLADDVSSADSGFWDVAPGTDASDGDVVLEPDVRVEPDVSLDVEEDAEEPECVHGTIEQCVDRSNVCLSTYRSCVNEKWSSCKRLSQLAGVASVLDDGLDDNLSVDDLQVFLPVECEAPSGNVEMTYIHAGSFYRGNNHVANQPDVAPQREIYLTHYYLDTYEVSRAQYKACIDSGGCQHPVRINGSNNNCITQFSSPGEGTDPRKPVACVSFDMAQKYCEEQGKRLATEAEWEKAARGPIYNNEHPSRIYPWGNDWSHNLSGRPQRYANMLHDNIYGGRCVANREVNDGYCLEAIDTRDYALSYYGLFHMAGNVAEYVEDYYQVSYYSSLANVNPVNRVAAAIDTPRVVRGGSFSEGRTEGTVFYRSVRGGIGTPEEQIGIRCAKDAP